MSNAQPSSSKLTPPPTSSTPTSLPRAKRPRLSDVDDEDQDDIHESDSIFDVGAGMDEAAAKAARKEARTIRNRESAQRSRNQRKAHLADLETRVAQLEAENRTLRGLPPIVESSASRGSTPLSLIGGGAPSPAQSVLSLANDLGIPATLVSGSGVNLANVAPPPADIAFMEDVKPVIVDIAPSLPLLSSLSSEVSSSAELQLRAENAVLKERVALLESLVKQVVAVSNLSGLNATSPLSNSAATASTLTPDAGVAAPLDWSAFLMASATDAPFVPAPASAQAAGLESTLSSSSSSLAVSHMPSSSNGLGNEMLNRSNPVACHPAAGEGESFDLFQFHNQQFQIGNDDNGGMYPTGQIQNGSFGQVGAGFGASQGMDSVPVANHTTMYGFGWPTEMDYGGDQVQEAEVQGDGEDWDQAMKALIEDIEGGSTEHSGGLGMGMGNALEVQLFGGGMGMAAVGGVMV